jgi:signal transduction histidine kinase
MGALVEGLLLLARSDAGLQVKPAPVDLAGLAVEEAQRHRRTGRDVRAVVPGAVVVAGDRDGLARLVANLVENAIRHGAGEVVVDVRPEGAEAVLRVADRGPGFPPGSEERVFERFARLDPARSGPGTGLGLAIARSIAVAHGGSTQAANRDGGGAIVTVRLPLA